MTTDQKVIGSIAFITIVILVGGAFLLSKDASQPSAPADQIIAIDGLHWHPKLTITIQGEKQNIPANLGIGAVHQKIHTHDEDAKDGVIHMEMNGQVVKDDTKLGNFFRIWGKEFTSTQIFDKTNGSEETVKMLVNGTENTDFENYLMKDGDTIEIVYE